MSISASFDYGKNTLEVISTADRFNRWMYEKIKPFCKGEILEVGSGIGNISKFFLEDGSNIVLSDLEKDYFNRLGQRFGEYENLRGIVQFDFADPEFEKHYPDMVQRFDTVFALNVLEHIPDHYGALQNCRKLLKPGGHVVILVPAFQWLFNKFDEQLGHQRRYTSRSLRKCFEDNHFSVIHDTYFNMIGMLGWFVTGTILGKNGIPEGQMGIYDKLVPFWKLIDGPFTGFAGLSVIQVGEYQK